MNCKIVDCARCNECGILEITKKIPENKHKCSYFVPIGSDRSKKEKSNIEISTEDKKKLRKKTTST